MKKILLSISMIAVVGVVVAGATGAFFSDTETSTGNFLTAGALDLKLNGGDDPVRAMVAFEDLKPSQTFWTRPIKLTIHNNPGKLFKHIVNETNDPISCVTTTVTEPECTDQGGLYQNGQCNLQGNEDKNDLHNVTWFDLERWVPGTNTPTPPSMDNTNEPKDDPRCPVILPDGTLPTGCWKVGIPDREITVGAIASKWIYLGEYGTPLHDNEVIIRQSFHMNGLTGNAYQSDSCTFKEEFQVIQTNAPMPLTAFGRGSNGNLIPWANQEVGSFFDVFFDIDD